MHRPQHVCIDIYVHELKKELKISCFCLAFSFGWLVLGVASDNFMYQSNKTIFLPGSSSHNSRKEKVSVQISLELFHSCKMLSIP